MPFPLDSASMGTAGGHGATQDPRDHSTAPTSVGGALVVTRSITVPPSALRWRFSRSSGPGGQGVNTTDSRVELLVRLDEVDSLTEQQLARIHAALSHRMIERTLVIVAAEHRSQLRNRQAARDRAVDLLRRALTIPAPQKRKARKPSRAAKQRRLEAKKRRGQTKSLRRRPDL